MRKWFLALAVVDAAMFAYAPFAINAAPYESTMLLVQKIFYFHFATWMAVTAGLTVCGLASAWYLFKGSPIADRIGVASAELVVIFTLFGLVSGSLWARKAWGIWWDWEPRLTMAFMLELIFLGYIVGPLGFSFVLEATQSYAAAFLSLSALTAIGAVVLLASSRRKAP